MVALLLSCGTMPELLDAGAIEDAGVIEDAGTLEDSGTPDAGAPDSGMVIDAGTDAGTPQDAGPLITCTANGLPGTCLDVSLCTNTRKPTAGLCPGPANIQCCTPRYANACDPNVPVRPNEGLREEDGGTCPPGMQSIDGTFCIDRYEASLDEVLDDAGTRGWPPYFNPGTTRVRARSLKSAVPQGYISGTQASAACTEAGKRLCTDAEWLRACRGTANMTYPYGNTRVAGTCNDARTLHPAIQLYGTTESWIFSHIDSPCLNQLDAGLERTATRAGCVTPEGVHDLMGNLHEWTADPNGTFRGGYYVDTVLNGNGCLYVTTAHATSHWDYSTGFRCCR